MSTSSVLSLPYIAQAQAQKHVTHNEALRVLDAVMQLSVKSSTQTTPPDSPDTGARYIVPEGGAGDWDGHSGQIAVWDPDVWVFYTPLKGWMAWDEGASVLLVWQGTSWDPVTTGTSGPPSDLQKP